MQELAERRDVRYVKGDANPADLFTKHLSAAKLAALMPKTSQVAHLGEASAQLRLQALGQKRPLRLGNQVCMRHLEASTEPVSHTGSDRSPGDSTNFWPSTPATEVSGQGGVLIQGCSRVFLGALQGVEFKPFRLESKPAQQPFAIVAPARKTACVLVARLVVPRIVSLVSTALQVSFDVNSTLIRR